MLDVTQIMQYTFDAVRNMLFELIGNLIPVILPIFGIMIIVVVGMKTISLIFKGDGIDMGAEVMSIADELKRREQYDFIYEALADDTEDDFEIAQIEDLTDEDRDEMAQMVKNIDWNNVRGAYQFNSENYDPETGLTQEELAELENEEAECSTYYNQSLNQFQSGLTAEDLEKLESEREREAELYNKLGGDEAFEEQELYSIEDWLSEREREDYKDETRSILSGSLDHHRD